MARRAAPAIVVGLIAFTILASGCLGGGNAATKTTASAAPPPEPAPDPAEAFSTTIALSYDKSPGPASFKVDKNWTTLTFTARATRTLPCSAVLAEPGTSSPTVEFRAKNQTVIVYLPATTSGAPPCGLGVVVVATAAPKKVPNELGEWTITISARGVFASVHVEVRGE